MKIGGPAEATVWGVNRKPPLETATACNAYLIHGNEIDDSDFRSNYLRFVRSLPAPLTVAEYTHATGRDLILATAIAYSVNGRLAAQLDRLQGLGLPSSVVGGGGSAAAASKLMRLNADQTLAAMGLRHRRRRRTFPVLLRSNRGQEAAVARAARTGIEMAVAPPKDGKGRPTLSRTFGVAAELSPRHGPQDGLRGNEKDFNKFEGPLYIYPKFTSCSSSIGPFIRRPRSCLQTIKDQSRRHRTIHRRQEWPKDGPFGQKILHFKRHTPSSALS
ncbi:MAG: MmgE/PrpD family protein [Acidobacteria bacterium]|nr:MmgE/PrpD family protein [Acidobacteriota bacterium]